MLAMVALVSSLHNAPVLRSAPRAAVSGARRALARMVDNDQGIEYPVQKTDEEWKDQLGDAEFYVLRQKGTERPGTGEYNKFYPKSGHFTCGGCGTPLYSAEAKL
jgi:hypothetical protein